MGKSCCISLLAVAACLAAPLGWAGEHPPQIKIDTGTITGKTEGPVRAFLGVPYAAPPVGDLRWKPPAPAAKWNGVREAVDFGARCMQGPIYSDMVFRDPGPSEDCLTLNVWTPARAAAKKLPVMVWIHGGGFQAGSTSEPRQDGQFLAQRGVVVVSMNYRLGVFGFFVLPELAAESGRDSARNSAGNYGLLDQTAALAWVHRNIAAFGGDPDNVTIFGESAGASSVSALMASPAAHGLFVKAIGESGSAFSKATSPMKTLAQREESDANFAKAALGSASLKDLRATSAQKVLEAALKKDDAELRFSPSVDGYFLPESVSAIFAAKKENKVSLLAGWNHDEESRGKNAPKDPTAEQLLRADAEKQFPDKAAEFLRLYAAASPEEAKRSLDDFRGDDSRAWAMWKWLARSVAEGEKPVYRYRFDRSLPSATDSAGLGAFHSGEIEYVFGALDSKTGIPWTSEDRALSELMQKYWANFARNGDPNGEGLPVWPAYRAAEDWPVMYLDAISKAEKDRLRDRYVFLDSVWGK
jgi:para-nitrobenzyl esterase